MKRGKLANTALLSVSLWALAAAGVAAQDTPTPGTDPNKPPVPVQTAPRTDTPSLQTPRPDNQSSANQSRDNQMAMNSAYPVTHVDRKFLEEAARGSTAEIKEAQLALSKTKNPEVIRIARRIIADHEKARQEVQVIAQANSFTLPDDPNPLQQASYTHLSKLSGVAFDKKYVAMQIQEHTNTINMFHQITEIGNSLEVKQFARKTLPALAMHAESFRQMARQVGVPATFGRPPASQIARGMNGMNSASASRMKSKRSAVANAGRP